MEKDIGIKWISLGEEDWHRNSFAVDQHLPWCDWQGDDITKIDFQKKSFEQVQVNPVNPPLKITSHV